LYCYECSGKVYFKDFVNKKYYQWV
jgi:hypothetical protein